MCEISGIRYVKKHRSESVDGSTNKRWISKGSQYMGVALRHGSFPSGIVYSQFIVLGLAFDPLEISTRFADPSHNCGTPGENAAKNAGGKAED